MSFTILTSTTFDDETKVRWLELYQVPGGHLDGTVIALFPMVTPEEIPWRPCVAMDCGSQKSDFKKPATYTSSPTTPSKCIMLVKRLKMATKEV
jgi:hypothetical protein